MNVPVAKWGLQPTNVLQFLWRHCREIIHSKLLPASENNNNKEILLQTRQSQYGYKKKANYGKLKMCNFPPRQAKQFCQGHFWHVAKLTLSMLNEMETLQKPPYDPDLAPSHIHLLWTLHNTLTVIIFIEK